MALDGTWTFQDGPPLTGGIEPGSRLVEVMDAARDLVGWIVKPYIRLGLVETHEFPHGLVISTDDDTKKESLRELEAEFDELSTRWHRDTEYLSGADVQLHPAYQRIIGMGPGALPFILRDLKTDGGHWFWALTAITGQDQAVGTKTVADAKAAWLIWGYEHNHLR